MMDTNKHIERTLDGLKDFQLKTVDYVIHQFYKKNCDKLLIADEVGLGKTIVAKGVIARMYKLFLEKNAPGEIFNIIYICSNQAIARQNLGKLNIFYGEGSDGVIDYSSEDDRLIALAYQPREKSNHFNCRIKAFTPATSFDNKTNAGKADERVLLFRLLWDHPKLVDKQNSLKWLIKGSRRMKEDNWSKLIEDAIRFESGKEMVHYYHGNNRAIRKGIKKEFIWALQKKVALEKLPKTYEKLNIHKERRGITLLKRICENRIQKNNYHNTYRVFWEIISYLRLQLSAICKEYLEADLFILDEFQRYGKILKSEPNEEPGIELAREVLHQKGAKVLLLSATPFKPYTNDFDELHGEDHYKEFNQVLQFLLVNKKPIFWQQYKNDRKSFYSFLRHGTKLKADFKKALEVKGRLEEVYRSCISRTERMLVSKEKDAMFGNRPLDILKVRPEDIKDFVIFDKIVRQLNEVHHTRLAIPLEYVKSCPFPLSFLANYQHKKKLEKFYAENPLLKKLVHESRNGWVDIGLIKKYKALIPRKSKIVPNAKLRLLVDETVQNNGWKYLWIPPSLPYYSLAGAFKGAENYTKTLIFSSWRMVPRMVSTLVSYEAERLSVGKYRQKSKEAGGHYFQKKRFPNPLLTYKINPGDNSPGSMSNFMLHFPSPYLAQLYDPADNLLENKSIREIKMDLKKTLRVALEKAGIFTIGKRDGDWQKWNWFAVLLLDLTSPSLADLQEWLLEGSQKETISPDVEKVETKADKSAKAKHLEEVKNIICNGKIPELSLISESQLENVLEYLVDLTLGSPAIASLRALQKNFESPRSSLLADSYQLAMGFVSLFNKRESIAILQLTTEGKGFHRKVLNYGINGNIQAMLDEYYYLLIDSNSVKNTSELATMVSEILSIKPSQLEIDSISNLKNPKKEKTKIRTHFALGFGLQKITSASANRQINVREAFNSPFLPFVLASTSIGQEGLDFHFYCKKIIHWNLPHNPIDLEQREGRIHRYKGHVIRLNIASKYKTDLREEPQITNPWEQVFNLAIKEKEKADFSCDLIPFWHLEPNEDQKIERIIPLYPFSKDIEKYKHLKKVLAYYRFTFGQPRQEELIHALDLAKDKLSELQLIEKLLVNLSPIKFFNIE